MEKEERYNICRAKSFIIGVVFVAFFGCFQPSVVFSSDLIKDIKSSFGSLTDFSSGLTGVFKNLDRKNKIGNINNRRDDLILVGVKFQQFSSGLTSNGAINKLKDMSKVKPEIIGMPLVYPNPFRQSIEQGAVLSYSLSKDFSFEMHIYNMQAQRVFKQTFTSGGMGARQGKNLLQINKESLGGYLLSSGVYFYVFVYDQKVLSKGKFVVKP